MSVDRFAVPDVPRFGFPAVAARAAGGAIGGPRETALAVLLICRLAKDATEPAQLDPVVRTERAQHARQWLGTLAIPVAVRSAASRCDDASAGSEREALAAALTQLLTVTADTLGDDAVGEVRRLVTNITI